MYTFIILVFAKLFSWLHVLQCLHWKASLILQALPALCIYSGSALNCSMDDNCGEWVESMGVSSGRG